MELQAGKTYVLTLVSQADESLSPYSYHGMPGCTPPWSPGSPIPDWYPVPLLSQAATTCLRAKYPDHGLEVHIAPAEVPGENRLHATVTIYVRRGTLDSDAVLADAKRCLDNLYANQVDEWGVRWGEIICPWEPRAESIQEYEGDKLGSPFVNAAKWGGVAGAFLLGMRFLPFGLWGGLAAAALGAFVLRPKEVEDFLRGMQDATGPLMLGMGMALGLAAASAMPLGGKRVEAD